MNNGLGVFTDIIRLFYYLFINGYLIVYKCVTVPTGAKHGLEKYGKINLLAPCFSFSCLLFLRDLKQVRLLAF